MNEPAVFVELADRVTVGENHAGPVLPIHTYDEDGGQVTITLQTSPVSNIFYVNYDLGT